MASYNSPSRLKDIRTDAAAFTVHRSASSASVASLSKSRQSHHDTGSRKRPRSEDTHYFTATPPSRTSRWSYASQASSTSTIDGITSPPSLVDTRYRLAGGSETPIDNVSNDNDFRRNWGNTTLPHHRNITGSQAPGTPSTTQPSKRKRPQSSPNPTEDTWGQYVYNFVGGLAGKVWEFCRGSAFNGFVAGDGPTLVKRNTSQIREDDDTDAVWVMPSQRSMPMPGQFPEETAYTDCSTNDIDEGAIRPAKRLQKSNRDGWVMVSMDRQIVTSGSTPSRNSRLLPRPGSARSVPARHSGPTTTRLSNVSVTGSPYAHKLESASSASPRRDLSSTKRKSNSLSSEAQRLVAKRERDERQHDASMKKLNHQLKAMIREGQAALATKVEVYDEELEVDLMDEDNNSVDEPYEMDRNPW